MKTVRLQKAVSERTVALARFRDEIPQLRNPSSAKAVKVGRSSATARVHEMRLKVGERTFDGSKEAAGPGSTYYVMRLDAQGVMHATPVSDWYTFRPSITYETMDLDEAEKDGKGMEMGLAP